jgi:hypothetical protein
MTSPWGCFVALPFHHASQGFIEEGKMQKFPQIFLALPLNFTVWDMRDKELYKQILGIQTPWGVTEVELSMAAGEVTVHVEHDSGLRPTPVRIAEHLVPGMTNAPGPGGIWIPLNSKRSSWPRTHG